jgi:transposase
LPKDTDLSKVDIWFGDESRVGQRGIQRKLWAPAGTRPRVLKQQGFQSAQIFGAICPSLNLGAALILPYCNKVGMELFLQEMSFNIPEGRHAVLVLDCAGWHDNLVIPGNITIIHLPPYSPELNPTEQVWQFIKDKWLSNRCFENYEAIVDAVVEAWNKFISIPKKIFELCSRDWAILSN